MQGRILLLASASGGAPYTVHHYNFFSCQQRPRTSSGDFLREWACIMHLMSKLYILHGVAYLTPCRYGAPSSASAVALDVMNCATLTAHRTNAALRPILEYLHLLKRSTSEYSGQGELTQR